MLFGWFGHFAALAAYTAGHILLSPLRRFTRSYTLHRLLDALQYGSASDYHYAPSGAVSKAEATALNAKLAAGVAGLATDASNTSASADAGVNRRSAAVQRKQQQQQRKAVDEAAVVVAPRDLQQQQQLWESPEIVSHLGQQVRYT
jgi:hypothetical protein